MVFDSRAYHKEYNGAYYKQNKERYRETERALYRENPEKFRLKNHKQVVALRKKIDEALGIVCQICGQAPKKKSLPCHQIYDQRHSTSRYYILRHIEDFVRLCNPCHGVVHGLMRDFGLSWDEIQEQKEKGGRYDTSTALSVYRLKDQWVVAV